jgi:hypothetical protein
VGTGERVEGVAAVFGEELEGGLGVAGAQGGGELAMLARDVGEVAVGAEADPGQQEQVDLGADGLPRLL